MVFYECDLGEALRQHALKIQQKVDSIPQGQYLASPDAVVQYDGGQVLNCEFC